MSEWLLYNAKWAFFSYIVARTSYISMKWNCRYPKNFNHLKSENIWVWVLYSNSKIVQSKYWIYLIQHSDWLFYDYECFVLKCLMTVKFELACSLALFNILMNSWCFSWIYHTMSGISVTKQSCQPDLCHLKLNMSFRHNIWPCDICFNIHGLLIL